MRRTGLRGRRGPMALALLTVTALIAACGGSSSSGTPASGGSPQASGCSNIPAGPIKVAGVIGLTGPAAANNKLQTDILQVDFAYFNAHSSVCGHKFALTMYDDKYDPATSVSVGRKLVSQGVKIVVQPSLGPAEYALLPYLMKNKIFTLWNTSLPSDVAPTAATPYAFNFGPSNLTQASAIITWAKSHNESDIGLISDGQPFAQSLAADIKADAAKAGLKVIKTVNYSPTAVDFSTPLTQLRQAGVKTLIPVGFSSIPALIAGIKQIGWVPHLLDWGILYNLGMTAAQLPAGTVDGCAVYYTPGQSNSELLTPTNLGLIQAGLKKMGSTTPSLQLFPQNYPQVVSLAHAIETANSLDADKLTSAMLATKNLPTNLPALSMTYQADHQGWPTSSPAFTMCKLKYGKYDIAQKAS
jgi:ABC-type branched-subunit amino acid transport system substrate-binding protein